MKLIGISGYKGSGKSTVASVLENQGWCVVSLADPMKRFLYENFNISEESLWGNSDKRALIRASLQHLGSDWGRKFHSGGWMRRCFKIIEEIEHSDGSAVYDPKLGIKYSTSAERYKGYVIPDVRFYDEAQAIAASGGQLWKCVRGAAKPDDNHVSERQTATWPDNLFDRIIDCNGSKEDLWKQLQIEENGS